MTTSAPRGRRRRSLAAAVATAGLLASSLAQLPAVAAPAGDESPFTAAQAAPTTGASLIDPTGQIIPAAPVQYQDGRYIVVLAEQPSTTYTGGVSGLAATAAKEGAPFAAGSASVRKYEQHVLLSQKTLAKDHGVQVQEQFATAINGFSTELTALQASELAKDPRVLGLSEDVELHPDYSSTEFLGLPGENGTWAKTYGGVENAGKGVVVGVIDSGIYPQQEFLAGEPVKPLAEGAAPEVGVPYSTGPGKVEMLKADGGTYKGTCQTGEDFTLADCNDKLLGAYYYADSFLAAVPAANRDPRERISPLGIGSHGTHTATTAAGNAGVEQFMNGGKSFGKGSGVAPAAKLSTYKICWEDTNPDTGGCYTADSVKAINQAVQDNVDVINYSISGSNTSVTDSVAYAFRGAAAAGIFVSASAGNSGPTANTVNHGAPWLTSVAASTFSNELTGTIQFADGTTFRGASSMTEDVKDAEVALAAEVGAPGKTADEVRLCKAGALDPAMVAGKVVVCDRGEIARVDKSKTVADAGGVGMILVNVTTGSEDADLHSVPTIHTSDTAVKTKVSTTDLRVSLLRGDSTGQPAPPLPQIAGFSSRGPLNAVNRELLKPDVAAPGVNVLAGVSKLDPSYGGDTFGLMSGTSMAAPNLAGMAALVMAKHPDWSPMAVKSALMTTATDVYKADGKVDTDNFATGAGNASPSSVDTPGLVYESVLADWQKVNQSSFKARDLNLPSVAIADAMGATSVQRTVKATEDGTWTFSGDVPGYKVTSSPASITLTKGQTATFKLTFTRDTAPSGWVHGAYSWTSAAGKKVTSPVTISGKDLEAESPVSGTGTSGSAPVKLLGGMTGQLTPTVLGMTKPDIEQVTKVKGPASLTENASNRVKNFTVPSGVKLLVVTMKSQRTGDDWDLRMRTADGLLDQTGATLKPSEQMVFVNPKPGTWTAMAAMFGSAAADGTSTGSLEILMLSEDNKNLTVTPNPVNLVAGETTTAQVNWKGLTPGTWNGAVMWNDTTATIVEVKVDDADLTLGEIADQSVQVGSAMQSVTVQPSPADAEVKVEGLPAGVSFDAATGVISGTPTTAGTYPVTVTATWAGKTATETFTLTVTAAPVDLQIAPIEDQTVQTGRSITPVPVNTAEEAEVTVEGLPDGVVFNAQTRVISGAPSAPGTYAVTVTARIGEQTATEQFTLTVTPPAATCRMPDLADNPAGSQYYSAVRWMQCEGISTGYADGTFQKARKVARGESVAFLHRYLKPDHTADGVQDFKDVPVNNSFYAAIAWAKDAKVTTGYTDKTFRPRQEVTRGEFALFLYRAAVENPASGQVGTDGFSDVNPGSAYRVAIDWAVEQGYVTGYKDGTFRPNQTIQRGEIAVILHRFDQAQQD